MPRDTVAIIVAGGSGRRFGRRKQYCKLAGRPLFGWALRAFARSSSVGAIVLVVPRGDIGRVRRQVGLWRLRKPVNLAVGGAARADSVRAGLHAAPSPFRFVAVHDAARPLVSPELIEKVLRAARRHGAAIAASRSRDTVKLAAPGASPAVKATLPRSRIWLAQTPQVFKRELLERAHGPQRGQTPPSKRGLTPLGSRSPQPRAPSEVTDDAQLVELLGKRVKLVESGPENLKITVPMDLALANWMLKREKGKREREK